MDFIYNEHKRNVKILNFDRYFNHLLVYVGLELIKRPNGEKDMITIEQRINLFHLLNQVLIYEVDGDVVELGCYTGQSALQIQAILEEHNCSKQFSVFDKFNLDSNNNKGIKHQLLQNFQNANLKIPVIYDGFFAETLPQNLPEKIAFVHIDCGNGGNPIEHKKTILFCLDQVYPRMSPKAVCMLMDYHEPGKTLKGSKINPGVKLACDEFFSNKKEKVHVLYGNHYSHGYFRKSVS